MRRRRAEKISRSKRGSHGITRRQRERGAYGTMLALSLPLLMGFLGIAVDMSHYFWVRGQLQNVADAAALAGAKSLNSTAAGRTSATTISSTYATKYKVNGQAVAPAELIQNETGKWDATSKSFTTTGVSDPSANAVRVTVQRQSVPNFFGRVMNLFSTGNSPKARTSQTVDASAIAVAGGTGSIPCGFPTAVASCSISTGSNNAVACPTNLSFQNGAQSVGLTIPDGSSPVNGNKAAPYFTQAIHPNTCNLPVSFGNTLYLQNGNDLGRGTVDEINAATNNGVSPMSVVLPVVDMSCGSGGPTYNGSAKVVGFLQMRLIGARWTGNAPAAVAAACPTLGRKNLCVAAGCTLITTAPGGGTIQVAGNKVYLVR